MAAKKKPKAKADKPVDPHADCPPAVWSGMGWECRAHGAEGVPVPRTREAAQPGLQPAPRAPAPAGATQARQIAELTSLVAKLTDRVAALEAG